MPNPIPIDDQLAEIKRMEDWRKTLQDPPVPLDLLGLIPQPTDPRVWDLAGDAEINHVLNGGSIEEALPPKPSFSEEYNLLAHLPFPVMNQMSVPSCVSHTAAHSQQLSQHQEEARQRPFNANQLHNETGPSNQGRQPDQILQVVLKTGIPASANGERFRIEAYAASPKSTPEMWVNTIKAAIFLGRAVWVCLLLPSKFDWDSGGAITSGYHEVLIVGYTKTHFIILNSWGENWGNKGLGRIPIDFFTQQNWQNGYVLAHAVTDLRTNIEPPPPTGLKITSFQPNQVESGKSFTIIGSGFRQSNNTFLIWNGQMLVPAFKSIKEIGSIAPKVTQITSGTVRLQIEGAVVDSTSVLVVLPPQQTPDPPPTGLAAENFRLTNLARVAVGLRPLIEDKRLPAQVHASDMAAKNYYSHNSPDGKTPRDRLTTAGFGAIAWGENIAAGVAEPGEGWNSSFFPSPSAMGWNPEEGEWAITTVGADDPEGALTLWMNSPGHRANIMNPGFTHMAVGYGYNPNSQWKHYWCQVFAALKDTPNPPISTLKITGYSANEVEVNQRFQIYGIGFMKAGQVAVLHGQVELSASVVTDTIINSYAPSSPSSSPISVKIGDTVAVGPNLNVTDKGIDPNPDPDPKPGELEIIIATKPYRGGQVGIWVQVYIDDKAVNATVSGSIVNGTFLSPQPTTPMIPARWKVAGKVGDKVFINATDNFGRVASTTKDI